MSFGGQIADPSVLGWLPRQHFDPEWPIESRYVGYGVRVKRDQDEDSDNDRRPEIDVLPNGDPVIGDELGAFYWDRYGNRRRHGAFWLGPVPSVVLRSEGGPDEDLLDAPASGQLVGDGGVPIDTGGTRTRAPGDAGGGTQARDGSGAGGATRTRRSSKVVPLRARETPDDRFSPHALGIPSWASRIPGDWTGLAGAGSSEYSQAETWHPDFLGLVASNRGDPGYGTKVFDTREENLDTDRWAYLQSLVSVVDLGASDGRALALQLGPAGRGGGPGQNLFVDYGLREVAYGAALRGGPFTTGGPTCTHPLGATADGFVVHPLHFQTGALWINAIGDGPFLFEDAPYDPEEVQQGEPTRVHLRWDAGQRVWRWQTYSTFGTPPPYVDPPGGKGTERSPTPQPGGSGRPQTGGSAAAAGGSSSSGGHLTAPSEPGSYDPVDGPDDILDEIDATNAADPALGEDILDEIEQNEAAAAEALAWYGAYNGETPLVGQGGVKPAIPRSTTAVAVPGLVVVAHATNDGQLALSGSRVTTGEQAQLADRAPQVGQILGWAAGTGNWDEWENYVAHSPYAHAMAAGGIAPLPPGVTMGEVLAGEATTPSQLLVAIVPGLTQLAFATPTQGGGVHSGVIVRGTADGELLAAVVGADGEFVGDPVDLMAGGGGSLALDDLTDVDTSGVASNGILYYDDGDWLTTNSPTFDSATITGKLNVGGLVLTQQASNPAGLGYDGCIWWDGDWLYVGDGGTTDHRIGRNGQTRAEASSTSSAATVHSFYRRTTGTPGDGIAGVLSLHADRTTAGSDTFAAGVYYGWGSVSSQDAYLRLRVWGGTDSIEAHLDAATRMLSLYGGTGGGAGLELEGLGSAPGNPVSGRGRLYSLDGTDLIYRDASGTTYDLLAGGGASLPWSALGDLLYHDGSAPAALSGNTTTTRKFLRQVGDGSASAAPAWDTLQAGDVPDLSGTYSVTTHDHDSDYAALTHDHDGVYSPVGHDHSGVYQPASATLNSLAALSLTGAGGKVVAAKADESGFEFVSGGGGGSEFADDVFRILGSSDATKKAAFEVDGFPTATTRAFTLPNANTTLAGLSVSQVFSAFQQFTGGTSFSGGSAATFVTSSPTQFQRSDATNDPLAWQTFLRSTTTTPANGIAGYQAFQLESVAGNVVEAARSTYSLSDVTDAAENADWSLSLMRAGTLTKALEVSADGKITTGEWDATAIALAKIADGGGAEGDVLTLVSGVWTPAAPSSGGASLPLPDDEPLLANDADPTKQLRVDLSGLGASTTRVVTPPGRDGQLALVGFSDVDHGASGTTKGVTIPAGTLSANGDAVKLWAFCDRGSSNTLLEVEGTTVVDLGTFAEPAGYVAVLVRTGSTTGRVALFGLAAGFTFATNADPDATFTLPGGMTWDDDDVDLTWDAGTGGTVYVFVAEQVGASGGGSGGGGAAHVPPTALHFMGGMDVTHASSVVSAWGDQSGKGRNVTQGTAGARPSLNSNDPLTHFLVFDGTADHLLNTSSILRGDCGEVWALFRIDGDVSTVAGGGSAIFSGFSTSGFIGAFAPEVVKISGSYHLRYLCLDDASGSRALVADGTALAIGTWYVVRLWSDGATIRMQVDGVEQALTATAGANDGAWWSSSTRNNVCVGATVRSGYPSGRGFLLGSLAELIVWDGVVLSDEAAGAVYTRLSEARDRLNA